MNRPLPRDPSEMTAAEGQAVDAAYESRAMDVKAKTREIATRPSEIIFLIDDELVAERIAALMRAYVTPGGDVLDEAITICKLLERKAAAVAELEVPDVDDEKILEEMRGDPK